jgi:hypothetical protein
LRELEEFVTPHQALANVRDAFRKLPVELLEAQIETQRGGVFREEISDTSEFPFGLRLDDSDGHKIIVCGRLGR